VTGKGKTLAVQDGFHRGGTEVAENGQGCDEWRVTSAEQKSRSWGAEPPMGGGSSFLCGLCALCGEAFSSAIGTVR